MFGVEASQLLAFGEYNWCWRKVDGKMDLSEAASSSGPDYYDIYHETRLDQKKEKKKITFLFIKYKSK